MNDRQNMESERALEALFEHAGRRPNPPAHVEAEVRAAVHAEWQTQNRRRQLRHFAGWALAASVVLAAFFGLQSLQLSPAVQPVPVARIELSQGPVSVLEGDRHMTVGVGGDILSGRTLRTSSDAFVALSWNAGGSLRVAPNSELLLTAADEVELKSGRLYFDSGLRRAPAVPQLNVQTRAGTVRHVGTQFLTNVTDDRVIVRVREGRVEIDGTNGAPVSLVDQGAELYGNGRYSVFEDDSHGEAWGWVAAASPEQSFNRRPVIEFLRWFSRETGRELRFEPASLEQVAVNMRLVFPAPVQPTAEDLDDVLSVTDLRSALVDNELVIRAATY